VLANAAAFRKRQKNKGEWVGADSKIRTFREVLISPKPQSKMKQFAKLFAKFHNPEALKIAPK